MTGSPLATATVDSTLSAPILVSASATDLEAGLRVRMVATQGSTPGTPFYVQVSVVLVLRSF